MEFKTKKEMEFKTKEPLVSIIINCHNGAEYLLESLNSIKNQSYKKFEVVFFDNASTDNSSDIFQSYKDENFKYFYSEKKLSLYHARNKALEECEGEFITFLDTDDLWHADKLEKQVNIFRKNKDIDFIYSYFLIKDEIKKKLKLIKSREKLDFTNHLLKDYDIGILTIAIRKQLLIKHHLRFNSSYTIIGDFDFCINLSRFCKFYLLRYPTSTYRLHKNSYTVKNSKVLISELKHWYNQKKEDVNFKNYRNLRYVSNKILYYEGIEALKDRKKLDYIKSLNQLPFGYLKFKLIAKKFTKNY